MKDPNIIDHVKITYCKRCGGQIDNQTRKCMNCGRQYIRPNSILIIILDIIIIGLCIHAFSQSAKIQAYKEQINDIQTKLNDYQICEEYIVEICKGRVNPETYEAINTLQDYIDALEAQRLLQEDYDYIEESPNEDSANTSGYIGNSDSYVFHRASCEYASLISEDHSISQTRGYFLSNGYSPCKYCKP